MSWSSKKGASLICRNVNPRFEIVDFLLKLLDLARNFSGGLAAHANSLLQEKLASQFLQLATYIYNQCETNVAVTGGVVNVRIIVQQHSSNIIRKIMFGSRYLCKERVHGGFGNEDIEFVDSLLKIAANVYAFCLTDYLPWLRWITDFDGHEKNIRNALHTARKYINPLTDERIQQWKDGVRMKEDDLLDVFVNLKDPRLTADNIKAQILDLFLATFDNTPNSIECC
ncbi:cytochrome P450 [Artemisia annua]|uniref:Cytochrome P450 n=1 Tax=Artemisia annua TaxID=35608 RepID=A0A2U1P609_ARTAN|nr:cytochrome P450 [Artemisia annua]